MSDPDYKDDEVEKTESDDSGTDSTETTPAGSYRLPGQDTSGFLGVDDEYKNSAGPGGEAILTAEEEYLYLPAPADEEPDGDDEDEDDEGDDDEESSEAKPVEVSPEDPRVEVNPAPARPVL